jgi:mRNA-degrading endonuclease RelE of RelBE toxin-antitoxin system
MMKYEETPEFGRDLKRLLKRFPTLRDDLETLKKSAIELRYGQGIDNGAVFEIPGFCRPTLKVAKVKKFACKSIKGRGNRTGLRLIFVLHTEERRVVLLQLYFKADQANEDRERIKGYLG